jgi:hypothetical protein
MGDVGVRCVVGLKQGLYVCKWLEDEIGGGGCQTEILFFVLSGGFEAGETGWGLQMLPVVDRWAVAFLIHIGTASPCIGEHTRRACAGGRLARHGGRVTIVGMEDCEGRWRPDLVTAGRRRPHAGRVCSPMQRYAALLGTTCDVCQSCSKTL